MKPISAFALWASALLLCALSAQAQYPSTEITAINRAGLREMRKIAARHRREFNDFCNSMPALQPTPANLFQAGDIAASLAPDPVLGAQIRQVFRNEAAQRQAPAFPAFRQGVPQPPNSPSIQELQQIFLLLLFHRWMQEQERQKRFDREIERHTPKYALAVPGDSVSPLHPIASV